MVPLRKPNAALGLAATIAAVAVVTLLLYPLGQIAPAISLGVVYLIAVLLIAAAWGLALGFGCATLSALAFNFFHIPPTGRFTIADTENWVALIVFLVAAAVASTLARAVRSQAEQAEERRREADLAAELARVLLGASDLGTALPPAAQRTAAAFGLSSAALSLEEPEAGKRHRTLEIDDGHDRPIAWLTVPDPLPEGAGERIERMLVPTLSALLVAALTRRRLVGEVVETRALRRSEDIKTTLLRTVSHDLRTPLTAIVASAEALSSPALEAGERQELASGTAEQARHLARMVDDLLDLSRLEVGRADPRRAWVSIEEIIEAARGDIDGCEIKLQLPADLPLLNADGAQLERALHNLLENAARHSGGEPVIVRGAVVGAKLVVRVTDSGPGVSAEEQERIFEPFHRGAGQPGGGSGLGLAIARGFVETNGGTIEIESVPGQGATFVVKIPLVEGAR